ncbi:MAG: hypothetical protein FWD34_01215 [Oscillospiraceae bacterium]|nr:hypothetical protein [Oscillospiraceae bacterium]
MLIKNKNNDEIELEIFSGEAEVDGALDCLVSVFGNKENYYHPERFDPEYLKKEIRGNRIKLFTGKAANGDTAVTLSLIKNPFFNKAYELCALAVSEGYRGFHAGEAFTEAVLSKSGDTLFYAYAVLFYPHSAISLNENKFVSTGFVPGIARADKYLSQLNLNSQKHTYAMFVKNDGQVSVNPVYVPEEITDLTKDVYNSLNAEPVIKNNGSLKQNSVIEYNHDSINETLFIYVTQCGNDLFTDISEIENKHKTPLNSNVLFLNINEPSAIDGYGTLRERGYTFNGFMPLCGDYEYIIMTKTNEAYIDYDELQMTDELKAFYERIKNV